MPPDIRTGSAPDRPCPDDRPTIPKRGSGVPAPDPPPWFPDRAAARHHLMQVGGGRGARWSAGGAVLAERHLLVHRAEPELPGRRAERRGGHLVLDLEDRFAGLDERPQPVA